MTIAGKIGIKCWICKKQPKPETEEKTAPAPEAITA